MFLGFCGCVGLFGFVVFCVKGLLSLSNDFVTVGLLHVHEYSCVFFYVFSFLKCILGIYIFIYIYV